MGKGQESLLHGEGKNRKSWFKQTWYSKSSQLSKREPGVITSGRQKGVLLNQVLKLRAKDMRLDVNI